MPSVQATKAKKKARKMRAALPILVLIMLVGGWENYPMAKADMSRSQSELEKRLLINARKPVAFGQNPSADCCQRVRVTHAECVCPSVTPKLAALVGVERAIKQIEGRRRTVPRNFKRGSVTTPPRP